MGGGAVNPWTVDLAKTSLQTELVSVQNIVNLQTAFFIYEKKLQMLAEFCLYVEDCGFYGGLQIVESVKNCCRIYNQVDHTVPGPGVQS